MSIGIFDSGLGGLSIYKNLQKLMPFEDFIYLADQKNYPYGEKTPQQIKNVALACVKFLLSKNVKLIIVACNTVCSYALELLQKISPVPVIGVIQSACKIMGDISAIKSLGLIATKATIQREIYSNFLIKQNSQLKIFPLATPTFAGLIEKNLVEDKIKQEISTVLAPLKKQQIDYLLLGCTHYSFLGPMIESFFDNQIQLIDPSIYCASFIKSEMDLLNLNKVFSKMGKTTFFTTKDKIKFTQKVKDLC